MQTSSLPDPAFHLRSRIHSVRTLLTIVGLLTAIFLAGHVPFIPNTRDGIDSTNFLLAVDRYDPAAHQPHPPGFPLHVVLGRLVAFVYRAAEPEAGEIETAVASLRLWSVICGGLVVLPAMWVAIGLGFSVSRATLVTALSITCPLFWLTAMRPLSDVPGLLFAMISQGLAMTAYNDSARPTDPSRGPLRVSSARLEYWWVGAAFVAGLAIGMRVQTALLTVPLLAALAWLHVRHAGTSIVLHITAAFAVGVIAWAVPMLIAVGGPAEYLRLLTTVGADDVRGVEMLATHPELRLLVHALSRTFIVPWGSPILGWFAVALSIFGAVTLASHDRRMLALIAAMGLPYLVFHLCFQETASIRYALPLVPVSCLLIVANLARRPARLRAALTGFMIVTAGALRTSAAFAYGRAESPSARSFQDVKEQSASRTSPPTLAFHHSVARALRGEAWPGVVLAGPVRYEWLELATYWLKGGRDPVWFLADKRRTDLALVDSVSRKFMGSYHWPASTEALLGGSQPPSVNWYEIAPPGWFLLTGWSVTPETNGVARRDNHGPGIDGSVGYIKRRESQAVMMIGGRNLGGPCDTAAMIEVQIDGRSRVAWTTVSRSPFLQVIALAPGELRGPGDYATVKVTARDAGPGGRIVDVAVEDFDVQSPGSVAAGFDRGWHMPEADPSSGLQWRWIEEAADLRVESFGRDVELVIRGESPLRYFQRPPHVLLRAGSTEIASFHPTADFDWRVTVPAASLAATGRVTIETDEAFVPDEVRSNGDRRRLALRIYSVEVRPRAGQDGRPPPT